MIIKKIHLMIISLILIPVQMFGISIINTFGEDASTGNVCFQTVLVLYWTTEL